MKKSLFAVVGLLALVAGQASASISFTGSSGSRAASAQFDIVGGNLQVVLTNTSTADVTIPTQVLTALFFDIAPFGSLTRISAVVPAGSTVQDGSTDPGGVVGGEWAYKSGSLTGAPGGAMQVISSAGLGLVGPGDRFLGTNLNGPTSPDGVQYGITTFGDNSLTGNGDILGTPLIKNSVVFVLGGLPVGFALSGISNVSFQYGTGLEEPHDPGRPPQAPDGGATLMLLGGALAGLEVLRRKFTA